MSKSFSLHSLLAASALVASACAHGAATHNAPVTTAENRPAAEETKPVVQEVKPAFVADSGRATRDEAARIEADAQAARRERERNAVAEAQAILESTKLFFAFDEDRLNSAGETALTQVAQILSTYPNIKVRVSGSADPIGTKAHNDALSKRRAQTAVAFLVKHGVKTEQLDPVGLGAQLTASRTSEARSKARSVSLALING